MNSLQQLYGLGQSPWYDNISRDLLDGGEIQQLVDSGIRGLTSNPAIFKNAITKSTAYDTQLRGLLTGGDPTQIYEALAIEDIRRACDILRPIYDASDHVDGFVSLEVSPLLAGDTAGTLDDAQRLYNLVDRSNLYIKIPATSEGIPAIEEVLYRGIPVNITLIFSRDSYRRVMEAYIHALERRLDEGKNIDEIRSVASFFISRVDTLVDSLLAAEAQTNSGNADHLQSLMGKAGIANAKLAYQDFREMFGSERFTRLEQAGAKVQRPLWASTSTKNPAYPDTMYVDNLIGVDTVNTMPGETVDAYLDHGKLIQNSIETEIEAARAVIADLEAAGILMDTVTQQLLDEGIEKFSQPFEALLSAIDQKVRQMAAG